jgi:hypothetical protein
MGRLAVFPMLAMAVRAQSPSQQIQAQQQREIQARAEQQRHAVVRQQREAEDRQHAEERLLQRRAEAEPQRLQRQQAEPQSGQVSPQPVVTPVPVVPVQPRPDFSPGLMARAAAVGLLAGAAALFLGKAIQGRFLHN